MRRVKNKMFIQRNKGISNFQYTIIRWRRFTVTHLSSNVLEQQQKQQTT